MVAAQVDTKVIGALLSQFTDAAQNLTVSLQTVTDAQAALEAAQAAYQDSLTAVTTARQQLQEALDAVLPPSMASAFTSRLVSAS